MAQMTEEQLATAMSLLHQHIENMVMQGVIVDHGVMTRSVAAIEQLCQIFTEYTIPPDQLTETTNNLRAHGLMTQHLSEPYQAEVRDLLTNLIDTLVGKDTEPTPDAA